MARASLGLDIGTASIKAVELTDKRDGCELRNLIKIDLPWVKENIDKETITVNLIRDFIRKYRGNLPARVS